MRKLLLVVSVMVLLGTLAVPISAADGYTAPTPECDFPLTVEDATGTEMTLDAPPERVVTTTPSAAQVMWDIEAEEKVVGLTEWALYLDGADERTLVMEGQESLDIEQVVDLEPDLVLAPNTTDAEAISQLRDADVTVYHFAEEESIDDIFETTETIGQLTGECDGAGETIEWMDEELAIVADAVEGEERPGAMYLFFDFTVGANTFINEIIETAGAENLAASAGIDGYEPVSDEIVVAEDPEWIIVNADDPAMPESDALEGTTAVQEEQFVEVQTEYLNQPAPGTVNGIITLVEAFHPEAYADAVAAAEADDGDEADDITEADDGNDADDSQDVSIDETDDDDTDALPGFGPVVALIGIGLGVAGHRVIRRH